MAWRDVESMQRNVAAARKLLLADIATRERFTFSADGLSWWQALLVSINAVGVIWLLLEIEEANVILTIVKWWAVLVTAAAGLAGAQIVWFLAWRRWHQ